MQPNDTTPPSTNPNANQPSAPAVTPTPPAPTGNQPIMPPTVGGSPAMQPKGRKRWFWPVVIALIVVILAAGYAFAFYLPNTPGNVYKKGLSNTAAGYDKLTDYIKTQQAKHYKGVKIDGTMKVTAAGASGDGKFSLVSDSKNASGSLDLDIMGEKFTANMREVTASGQKYPDVYLQVTGIKSTLDSFGLNSFDNLDGQWISFDHTLFDSIANSTTGSTNANVSAPTSTQVQDALVKLGAVNRDYIFSTASDKAVLVNKKYLGTSTQDGRKVYGYQVGYNKAHLKNYVDALGQALDSSSLNDWAKKADGGKSISKEIDTGSLKSDIDKLKTNYTFNLYVDAKTKLIHQVHFPDTADPLNNYTNFGLNYTGGSSYPFVLETKGKEAGSSGVLKLVATLDTDNNKVDVALTVNGKEGDSAYDVASNFTVVPNNEAVKVTAPAGAKPVTDVLAQLGLSGALDGSQGQLDQSNLYNDSLFTLTQ